MHKYSFKSCISMLIVYTIILLTAAQPCSALSEAYGWYCIRNSEHKQMRAAAELSFVDRYNGYYVDKKHGDGSSDKVVYLTFDLGYKNENVTRILDILKEESVPGAFFILGNLLKRDLPTVNRLISEGHIVANHTMHHRDVSRAESKAEFQKDLKALEDLYTECTGLTMPKYFRPPEGRFSRDSMRYASELGYKTIFWSIAYADWDNDRQPSAEHAKEKILGNLHNGAVILLHPTSATNASVLKEVITEIRRQGYRFGTLDELTK